MSRSVRRNRLPLGDKRCIPRALHPTMTELRQCDGIALAREDGIENRFGHWFR